MNAIVERWVKTIRAEILDRTLVWNEQHLRYALREYELRPHLYERYRNPSRPETVGYVDKIVSADVVVGTHRTARPEMAVAGRPACGRYCSPAGPRRSMSRSRRLFATMVLALAGLAFALPGVAAASQSAPSCSSVVRITHLAFNPAAVTPGETSTASLTAVNCTGTAQQTTATWFGSFLGAGTGIPPGCPAIDPLPPQPADFTPYGTYKSSVGYLVPASCTADELAVTVQLAQDGTVIATKTTDLAIVRTTPTSSNRAALPA